MRVAVVCENPRWDQFIVRPIIAAALASLGFPRAKVFPVTRPVTASDTDVIQKACEILERWAPPSDAVVFVVDADCEDGQPGRKDKELRLRNAIAKCRYAEKAVAVAAIQETEVWALWGVRDELGHAWAEVRDECDPKERFFVGRITKADGLRADGGRQRLVDLSLSAGWASLCGGCPELGTMQEELREVVTR